MILVNGEKVIEEHFPDNTLHLNLKELPNYCYEINIDWIYESDAELFTLACIVKHYNVSANLFMPYIPHARMDRVQNSSDVFTLKYFCDIINSLHFDKVVVRDPHSNVSLALLNNVVEFETKEYIEKAILDFIGITKENIFPIKDCILFFPDQGAAKRYGSMNLGLPYTFGIKNRDWETGKILSLEIANPKLVEGKRILIVDDICSKGGTFYYSAKALKESGAKEISLYVSHCENTILQGKILDEDSLIKKIYTSKSLIHVPELKNKLYYVEDLPEKGDYINDAD